MNDAIELLREGLIEENKELALEVLGLSSRLEKALGWHYLLDLIWVLKQLEGIAPKSKILEIGAGYGLLQFLLADRGYEVVAADMRLRPPFPAVRALYRFQKMGNDQEITHDYLKHHELDQKDLNYLDELMDLSPRKALNILNSALSQETKPANSRPSNLPDERPAITNYRCDASDMKELHDDTFDAVVSISALEHNPPEKARLINRECVRVVKPGGLILHTVSAAKSGQPKHDESHSFLLDEAGLISTYELENPISNFEQYDRIFADMENSKYLSRWLAHTYYTSERNGMPWGNWAPAYQPVGVKKHA